MDLCVNSYRLLPVSPVWLKPQFPLVPINSSIVWRPWIMSL